MGRMVFTSTNPVEKGATVLKLKDNRYLKEAKKYRNMLYVSGIINIILLLTTLLRK